MTPEYWDERFAVNLKHQFFAAQAVYPMMKRGWRRLDHQHGLDLVDGGAGRHGRLHGGQVGGAGATRSLARDWGPDKSRVNSLAPGWIMTERQKTLWLNPAGEQRADDPAVPEAPAGPRRIARVVLFLAADDSSAMTNQSYVVDGGWV